MRIISWNCNGAFRDKYERVASFDDDYGDDILVIQESEAPDLLPARLIERYPNVIWVESTRSKGLLVMGSKRYELAIAPQYDETFKFIVPVAVTGESDFTLIAVWAQKTPEHGYTDYILEALKHYEHMIDEDTIVVGDFNSTPKVKPRRSTDTTHMDLVAWLECHGLHSAYHEHTEEAHGAETFATYAHRRKLDELFHLDYLFASERALRCSAGYRQISEEDVTYSDHLPIFVNPGVTRRAEIEA